MDLFEFKQNQDISEASSQQPLAEILRPKDISEILGQQKFLSEKSNFRKLIESNVLPSLILWGPPGCGKTTFAQSLSKKSNYEFIQLNAVSTGAKELREQGESAKLRRLQYQKRSILFVDEIHRLNKAQQDVLLPYVEKADLVLIGATTENPSFEINSALLSRCQLLVFEALQASDIKKLWDRALAKYQFHSSDILNTDAEEFLIATANGDARRFLNSVEQVFRSYELREQNKVLNWPLNKNSLIEILSTQVFYYNKNDAHYDSISAFIKSIRGSDADAALYYLARMIKGGEDPVFIARRLVILASEDVGNADPRALQIAVSAMQAVQLVGLPECGINLAQAVTYLSCAPKSNRSYAGYKLALAEVEDSGNLEIPKSLRNAPTQMMKNLDYGKDYAYAHSYPQSWVDMQFLPNELKTKKFYDISDMGYEKHMKQYMQQLKKK